MAPPRGFSHAVRTDRPVTVYLAGQTALDADGKIIDGDIVEQFEQAFASMLRSLDAAGGQPSDLATVTIYIVDMQDYRARARDIGAVWRRLAGTEYPAMAGIGVTRLWDIEALVEVQGIATIENPTV
ncbi:MAG: RidA family protein [Kineosporiaceae bacterium]|nr:RidA family protein [Aeromicrobium sp.]